MFSGEIDVCYVPITDILDRFDLSAVRAAPDVEKRLVGVLVSRS
jgi:hypothetical protein